MSVSSVYGAGELALYAGSVCVCVCVCVYVCVCW